MNILITGHHSLANRGCEALLRSTVAMVRSRHPQSRFWVPSVDAQADAAQWPEAAEQGLEFLPAPQGSAWLQGWARACRVAPGLMKLPWPNVRPPREWWTPVQQCDVMLAIGGDNYTLDYGLDSLALHIGLTDWVMRQGCPSVLWGASVGPFDGHTALGRGVARHLRRLQAVTVRESITAQSLAALLGRPTRWGSDLQRPQMRLVADPAFTLQPQALDCAAHEPAGTAPLLGLNVSPMVMSAAQGPLLDEWAALIRRWCESGRWRVVLVAHVSARDGLGQIVHPLPARSDDSMLLDQLMARLHGLKGVARMPAWNAAALKHAIARCDVFIGARTHSVIAALSSGVPALALAYSPKARGIHRDLFGHEKGVLPVKGLTPAAVDEALTALQQRAALEREQLQRLIPQWQTRARQALEVLPGA